MARLTIQGEHITREDLWPPQEDVGRLVILPGGEVGKLVSWWNADDGSEWRWRVEFYNHRWSQPPGVRLIRCKTPCNPYGFPVQKQ